MKPGKAKRKRRGGKPTESKEEEEEDPEEEKEEVPQEDAKPIGEAVRFSGKGRGRGSHFKAFEFDGSQYELKDPVLLVPEDTNQKPYVAIIKGGILWFQNLTEFPHGIFGPIFPMLIGGVHYINVQLSFGKSSILHDTTGPLSLLAKYYKMYLDILTLPLVFIGFYIPQGSLIYWVTNSSLNLIQSKNREEKMGQLREDV